MPANTASLLPTFPRIFFLYVEPVLISYGMFSYYAQTKPLFAASAQAAAPLAVSTLVSPAVAVQFIFSAMLYGLAILLSSPPNKHLLQLHIGILTLADLTHWYGLFWTIAQTDPRGWGAVLDTSVWTPDVWNLAVYPFGTLSIKVATLLGWFGEIKG